MIHLLLADGTEEHREFPWEAEYEERGEVRESFPLPVFEAPKLNLVNLIHDARALPALVQRQAVFERRQYGFSPTNVKPIRSDAWRGYLWTVYVERGTPGDVVSNWLMKKVHEATR
jgi:hypothetical protein